jgi:hypothetical protein
MSSTGQQEDSRGNSAADGKRMLATMSQALQGEFGGNRGA